MSAKLIPVAPDRENATFRGLRDAFDGRTLREALLAAGIAYATREGVNALIGAMKSAGTWATTEKRIIIGVHQGITEPAALELLLTLPRSDIRAFVPGSTLDLGALTRVPVFHPKFLALTSSSLQDIAFIRSDLQT